MGTEVLLSDQSDPMAKVAGCNFATELNWIHFEGT